jgi:hypothetical protein
VNAAWLQRGLTISVTLLIVTACGASNSAGPNASSNPVGFASPATPAPMVTSAFAALDLSHPAGWRQYFQSPSDNLSPQTTGYLTNEPIPGVCRGTSPATVACGQPVGRMRRGGVYITVDVIYQQPQPLPQANRTIDGYPADVVTGGDPANYGCPSATTRIIAATLSRTAVQPTRVWIFACLGGRGTRQTEQQIELMLKSARIDTRPTATDPVPGAPSCSSHELAVEPAPPLSLMTGERGLEYAVRNIGRRTCRVSGYPQVQLSSTTASLPFGYQYGGPFFSFLPARPPVLYLRPGGYASFQIDTTACVTSAGIAATTVRITLPGQTVTTSLPLETRTGPNPLGYCAEPGQIVHISALNAY